MSKHLKAQLFSAVAAILDEVRVAGEVRCQLPLQNMFEQGEEGPEAPKENVMINSLIHEYLEFNGMVGTSRMLALGKLP